jgi:class 3 adenylate cyclase
VAPEGTPDEVRKVPFGILEIYNLDDLVFGRTVFEPGWVWSKHVGPIAGTELCMYHHIGYSVRGTLGVRMADGSETEIGPACVFDLPPGHEAWVAGDDPWITIDVNGMRSFARVDEGRQRMLAAILFTDIVDSTATAERLGPGRWKDLVDGLQQDIVFQLDRYRGRLVKSTGDGILAVFDGSERAVRAASSISDAARSRGIHIRAGVHTGELEQSGGDVHGLAVHVAARVTALAGPDQILVSGTTRELVGDSGLEFDDAGTHELKGLTGARQLFAFRRA